jgi:two-component system, sensor histidine kinase
MARAVAICGWMRAMTKTTKSVRRRRAAARPRRRTVSRRPALEATLAALAHDIRTPLTGILALSELLVASGLDERERGWAASIKSTAEHLAMLASLIVDAARAGAKGRLVLRRALFHPAPLAEVLAASLAARCASKDLASDVKVARDLPQAVIGDLLRLRGALENLIDNAVKFTDRGGVRLDVGWEKAAGERVRLNFAVPDSGIGLSAQEIKRLFRPFSQANAEIAARFGGAGLGLAFVKRIARAMNGDLTVSSRPGKGSTFRLTVTVDRVAGAELAAADAKATPPHGAPLRPLGILCVEDNPYGRVVLNTILTELGHRADFVGTGEAAVEAVAGTSYDAVLMDVTLPGISGIEATRRIRALAGKRVPVIGVSGRGSAEEEQRARAAGMDDYLPKPLSPSALARVLAPIAAGN